MSDNRLSIRVLNEARADDIARVSRVPCKGECIQYMNGARHVRVLSVLHIEDSMYAAQVTAEDVADERSGHGHDL